MVEEALSPKIMMPARQIIRSKLFLVALALLAVMPLLWIVGFHSAAQSPVPCEVEYDALVRQAKQELIDGNRSAALNSLIAARTKLRDCETPTAKDVAPLWQN